MDVNEAFLLPQKMSLIITATTSNWRFIFLFFFWETTCLRKWLSSLTFKTPPPLGHDDT